MLLHSSTHNTVDYTAREGKGPDALLKHYIGVFDPKTGKMQVVEAKKMVIRGVVRAKQATEEEMVQKTAAMVRMRLLAPSQPTTILIDLLDHDRLEE